jgi:glutamine cyclotransferase
VAACQPDGVQNTPDNTQATAPQPAQASILQITNATKTPTTFADALVFEVAQANNLQKIDSVQVFLDGKRLQNITKLPTKITYLPKKVGNHALKFTAYQANVAVQALEFDHIVLSNLTPEQKTYEVLRTYPHNATAYTQGLEFDNQGNLYEGTGLEGRSMLRKINLTTAETLQETPLPPNYFGEGITIFQDNIIQLTWQNHKAIVYDKTTLKPTKELYYATEGWGLTHNADQLIMTDGTEKIYFVNAQTFATERTLQVYDHTDKLPNLNELEYIDGKIYANVYQTNQIAVIEPTTGRVLQYINLQGLPQQLQNTQPIDVLNGIAYNNKTRKLYVTGKLWNKIFEIRIKS